MALPKQQELEFTEYILKPLHLLYLMAIFAGDFDKRLHQGHFVWPTPDSQARVNLTRPQLDALVLGLPWSRIGEGGIITVV